MSFTNAEKMTISLRSQTLADSITLDHLTDAALGTKYSGTHYAWPWGCTVTRKTAQGKRYALTGDYDIAAALRQYVTMAAGTYDAENCMVALASQLDKTLSISIDNHYINFPGSEVTIMDTLSNLFGWTSAVPHRMVNVFLRGSTLHCLQRGKEASTYTPVKFNVLSQSQSRVDTLMDTAIGTPKITGEAWTDETEAHSTLYSGTFTFGNASVTFSNGLCTEVVEVNGATTTTTTNTYGSGYITSTDVVVSGDKNERTYTEYTYGTFENLPYKSGEITLGYKNSVLKSKSETNYFPLGLGFYGQSNTSYSAKVVDGSDVFTRTSASSSVSEGRPGGKASQFQIQRAATSHTVTPSVTIATNPIAPAQIPVTDVVTLQAYADGLTWLDGKTEYRMQINCYDAHIIDFVEKISVAGSTWYLDANTIVVGKAGTVQTCELVRWA